MVKARQSDASTRNTKDCYQNHHQMRVTDKRVFATIGRNQTCHCLDPELLSPKIVREKITFLLLIHTQAVILASGSLSH